MAHRVDSANYITVSSKRRYGTGIPRTTIGALQMNMFQEEACLFVEASGLALNASGAADSSAGWGQMLASLERMCGRKGVGQEAAVVVNANPFTITVPLGTMIMTETGGPFSGGIVKLTESSTFQGRLIYILNTTGTNKVIETASEAGTASQVTVPTGAVACYININNFWYPLKP